MMPVRRFVFSRSTWRRDKENSYTICNLQHLPASAMTFYHWRLPHLDPLWAVVVGRRPGVRLSLLVQSGKLRVPREGVNAPCAVRAGGWNLPIRDEARLHSQRLWATCRVWINYESKKRVERWREGKRQREKEQTREGEMTNEYTRRKDKSTSPTILRRHVTDSVHFYTHQ